MALIKRVLKYYHKVPIEVINAIAPIYHLFPDTIRMGSVYKKEKNELARISKLSYQEIQKERNRSLRKLILYSYRHVPYYKELFDNVGLNPSDIKSVDDLKKIPFLTKEIISERLDDLISDQYKKNDLIYITTSGSTGKPTGFYVQADSHMRDWVYVYKMFHNYGYNPSSSKLMLRGKVFRSQTKGKSWQWDALRKELSVNVFELTPRNMEIYCRAIEKYKPDFAYGYMSAMYTLCKYISNRKKPLNHHFKGFIGISETINSEQRDFVEKTIKAPVLTFYGMSERVIIAGQKESGGCYYVEPLYGIAEIVNDEGKTISENNINGELVGTSLLNYGMPLIRFKTGDISSWKKKDVLSSIEGRWNHDVLIGIDMCPITMTALNMHSSLFEKISRYQLRQTEIGKVTILVVPEKNISRKEKEDLVLQFSEKVQEQIKFSIKIVKSIPPKENGKVFLVDQRLSKEIINKAISNNKEE